ncbi:hypothetical protein CSOJ01_03409 [Colletotrichum sojae]|uniref:Uncharacterized protein n=1 Tax=Colletotrichum sojae TaxID=2175907 RepID=A0A8H6JM44_9PEZI|nr:hypothetical protein CSOJ01_03409 [Colletotrichum sojae]
MALDCSGALSGHPAPRLNLPGWSKGAEGTESRHDDMAGPSQRLATLTTNTLRLVAEVLDLQAGCKALGATAAAAPPSPAPPAVVWGSAKYLPLQRSPAKIPLPGQRVIGSTLRIHYDLPRLTDGTMAPSTSKTRHTPPYHEVVPRSPAAAYLSDKSDCAAEQLKVNFKRACSVPLAPARPVRPTKSTPVGPIIARHIPSITGDI